MAGAGGPPPDPFRLRNAARESTAPKGHANRQNGRYRKTPRRSTPRNRNKKNEGPEATKASRAPRSTSRLVTSRFTEATSARTMSSVISPARSRGIQLACRSTIFRQGIQ
jgi:hypothetical protein